MPDLWQEVQTIAAELNGLKPVITLPNSNFPLQVQILSGPLQSPAASGRVYSSIQFMQKEYQGETYLFAVNVATDTVVAEFSGLPISAGQSVVMFEGRTLPVTNQSFNDTFTEAEVHVYRLIPLQ